MEPITKTGPALRRLAIATVHALSVALVACAASTQTPALHDARKAYRDANSDSATSRVPEDMAAARIALEHAERAHAEEPGSEREARLAAIAVHRAKLAEARGELAETEAEANAAKANAQAKETEEANEAQHAARSGKQNAPEAKAETDRKPAEAAAADEAH